MKFKSTFLLFILAVSIVICGKSISLNWGLFSLGNVQVQAEPIAESLGKNNITAEAIPEPEPVQLTVAENLSVAPPSKPIIQTSKLEIPKIGLNVGVGFASVKNLPVLDEKLLFSPLLEDQLSNDFCSLGRASYVYGHSEPSVAGTESYPATYIFSKLDKLNVGDKISTYNSQGQKCTYAITEIFIVTTDANDQASNEDYAKLFYPPLIEEKSILTLQTCVKGSATQRLIVRGVSV
jgi:LPXTG-site transpeptidase (sortase) family protein